MQQGFEKFIRWGFYAIMLIGALLGIFFFMSDSFELMIQYSYVLFILTALFALVSPVFTFIQHPKNLKNLALTLGIVVVIALIAYLFSGNSYSEMQLETYKISASESTFISFGIIFTFIVSILVLITVVFSSVYKLFK
ncbi:hypothetical protein MASR2M12_21170 [Bacteroidales bacterium]